MTHPSEFVTTRRIVFQGLGALGVAAALAGCGGGGGGGTPASGTPLTTTADVPVGGGIILTEENVVITQATEGEFAAFSAVCTHAGNTVTGVENSVIECDFHGSRFDAATGEVLKGPANDALSKISITVEGDQILSA